MGRKGDISAWLSEQGLDRYTDAFAAHDVDFDLLPELSATDLKELGLSLGDRKRFQRAVEGLNTTRSQQGSQSTPSVDRQGRSEVGSAEQRQVTYGFCDLVGSTQLSTQHDAETIGLVLQRYHSCCRRIIEAWGGRVLSFQGDGVSFCFGVPTAHEDDPARAVHAGLEMTAAVPALDALPGVKLAVRIGVATGRVVVGDIVGDPRHGKTVAGAVTTIPSLLQERAQPNQLLMSDATHRLVSDRFEVDYAGEMDVEGLSDSVGMWHVLHAAAIDAAYTRSQASALVGRERELDFLMSRWRRARQGHGQTVLLSGEAGLGKTHLIRAFSSSIPPDEALQIRLFSAAYQTNTTLFPLIANMERSAGLTGREDREERSAKLIEALKPLTEFDEGALGILAPLLGVEAEGLEAAPYAGLEFKTRALGLFVQFLAHEAQKRPLLVILEDAHWCDPTTIELFGTLIAQVVDSHAMMLLINHRPEFHPPWPRSATLIPLRLERLVPDVSRALVKGLPAASELSGDIIDEIVRRADGVPLYLEELTKAVAEQGGETHAGATGQTIPVPASLADSLMSRLDRLHAGKRGAQIASAIGRQFSYEMLGFVVDQEPDQLNQGLAELVDAELVTQQGVSNDAIYTFRHALIQEAAYSTLLKSEVRKLHLKIADVLREFFPELTEFEPELLALHYVRAGQTDKATHYLVEAGVRALGRAAHVEAINHFKEAIEVTLGQPASLERDREEVRLRIFLGGALIAAKGYAAPDVHDTFMAAYTLCQTLDEPALMTSALYGLWVVQLARSDRAETIAYAAEMLDHAGASDDPAERIASNFADGITRFYRGDLTQAQACFDRVFDAYQTALNPRLVQSFGDDLGQFARAQSAWLATLQNNLERAEAHEAAAFDEAAALGDVMSEARACVFTMLCRHDRGDVAATREYAERAKIIAAERVMPFWLALAQCGLGWAMAQEGNVDEGLEQIEQGLGFFDLIDQKLPLTYWRSYKAETLTLAGRYDDAIALLDDTLALSDANVDSVFEPHLLRLKARAVMAQSNDQSEGFRLLERARDAAKVSGAHLYVADAERDLAYFGQA